MEEPDGPTRLEQLSQEEYRQNRIATAKWIDRMYTEMLSQPDEGAGGDGQA